MHSPSSHTSSRYWVSGFPDLVREWDLEANGGLTPDELSAGSARRVWWRCPCGPDHRWRAKPNNRTHGTGCPFCANRRVSLTNSLSTLHPELAMEWHPARNGALKPGGVVATTTRVVWWCCPADSRHEWRASVRDRARDLSSCPFCSNDRVCESNSLQATSPLVAAEWNAERNVGLTPDSVTSGSALRVWWRCGACAHEWQARIANRVCRASGCPACAHRERRTADVAAPAAEREGTHVTRDKARP
jgi:hypothetical protein